MTSIVVPTRNDIPAYLVRCDLSGVEFLFSFKYNERESFWFMSLFDQLGAAIVEGVKLTIGVPLLRNCVDERRPAGDLVMIDTTNAGDDARALEDLGDRVLLIYSD